MGVVDSNTPVYDNKWEEVKRGGDRSIKQWIDNELHGRSVTIVLIGSKTAGRKWIDYEIKESWDNGKGLLGIYVHNLLDNERRNTRKGSNPFDGFNVGTTPLATIVKTYDAPYSDSTNVYAHIKTNLHQWVEHAIRMRQ